MENDRPLIPIEDIKQRVIAAIVALYRYDGYLLVNDVNERSITHKLAEYLQQEFPNWNVDCEYNRLNGNTKKLRAVFDKYKKHFLTDEKRIFEDRVARTVYPDIIIHKRGSHENLVVIEVKKSGGGPLKPDVKKLKAFTDDAEYKYFIGLLLILDSETQASIQVIQHGAKRAAESERWTEQLVSDLGVLGHGG